MALNRLRFHNILVQDMGVESEIAERLTDVVTEATEGIVTNQHLSRELELVELRIIAEFRGEITRLLKWLLAGALTIGGAIIGLLIALIARGG